MPLALASSTVMSKCVLSDKPAPKPFQDWLAHEVVPAIEEKASYALPAGEVMPLPQVVAEGFAVRCADRPLQ